MKKITVNASKKYDVLIGKNLLEKAGEICSNYIGVCRAAIITDSNVAPLYSGKLEDSLMKSGYTVTKFVFEAGERSKNANTLIDILNFLADSELTCSDCIFALGGGVVGDISGFAASVFLRGIRFVQIPTTLLAAVDSSVGGKTAIDLGDKKNIVGAFHQPSLVICDCSLQDSLTDDIFYDGCAEVIKYGAINDKPLFDLLSDGFKKNIEEIVFSCVDNKRRIVEEDEFDTGKRQLLNFGHTIGHAIEKCSSFKISHGSAVAIGMTIVTRAASKCGFCDKKTLEDLISILERANLPTSCEFNSKELATVALSDKKRMGNSITLVIPYSIGDCRLYTLPISELESFIEKGLT